MPQHHCKPYMLSLLYQMQDISDLGDTYTFVPVVQAHVVL